MIEEQVAGLAALIERLTGGVDGVHSTAVRELTLHRTSVPSRPLPALHEPSLCLIARGSKQVLLAGEVYCYNPAQFLLVSADLPVTSQVTAVPYLALGIALNGLEVEELAAQTGPPTGDTPVPRAIVIGAVEPPLLDAIGRLVVLSEVPQDIPALAPLVVREIAYRLLKSGHGPRLRQIAAAESQDQLLSAVIRRLKGRYTEPLRVAELAREAGMSPSAFYEHFKAVTAMSPLQYQKRLRLLEAKRLLLAGGLAGEVSFQVGYESPSQFSREYRRLFGSPPRRDTASTQELAGP